MGYVDAQKRPGCRNCKHMETEYADRMPPFDTRCHVCTLARFKISMNSVCNKHEPRT